MHKIVLACIAACALTAAPVLAQNFPSRPIELVVPLAPGSTTDIAARLLAQRASETLGTQIVVVNKSGAGILLGTMAVVGYFTAPIPAAYRLGYMIIAVMVLVPSNAFAGGSYVAIAGVVLALMAIAREVLRGRAQLSETVPT